MPGDVVSCVEFAGRPMTKGLVHFPDTDIRLCCAHPFHALGLEALGRFFRCICPLERQSRFCRVNCFSQNPVEGQGQE